MPSGKYATAFAMGGFKFVLVVYLYSRIQGRNRDPLPYDGRIHPTEPVGD